MAKLAAILNVDVPTLTVAVSIACRLRFCRKLVSDSSDPAPPSASGGPSAAADGGGGFAAAAAAASAAASPGAGLASSLEVLDLDQMLRGTELGAPDTMDDSTASPPSEPAPAGSGGGAEGGGTGIALVVDSEVRRQRAAARQRGSSQHARQDCRSHVPGALARAAKLPLETCR